MGCGSSSEGAEPTSVEGNKQPEQQPESEKQPGKQPESKDEQETAGGSTEGRESKTSDDGDNTFSYFENVAVFAHNHFREMHQSGPVKLTRDLCNLAHVLAARMARSEEVDQSPSDHRIHQGAACGENLYWKDDNGMAISGDEAVKSWYNEKQHYDFTKHKTTQAAEHFTQLVWAGAQEMGIAQASSAKGTAVVAVYWPMGNVDGQFEENVKPEKT